ncbi:MAG: hypothetical protein AAF664_16930 [Planctomycetota bacterium]
MNLPATKEGLRRAAQWRACRIEVRDGVVQRFRRPWFPANVSIGRVWWQSHRGRRSDKCCYLDVHEPWGLRGYLSLDYVHSGSEAGYQSLVAALRTLDQWAGQRQSLAIVAHISTARITDRFLRRMGWESHMNHWPGRHFIRRFYGGYPDWDLGKYGVSN